jgi:hypothetical protein
MLDAWPLRLPVLKCHLKTRQYLRLNFPLSIILFVLYTEAAHTSLLASSIFYFGCMTTEATQLKFHLKTRLHLDIVVECILLDSQWKTRFVDLHVKMFQINGLIQTQIHLLRFSTFEDYWK